MLTKMSIRYADLTSIKLVDLIVVNKQYSKYWFVHSSVECQVDIQSTSCQ